MRSDRQKLVTMNQRMTGLVRKGVPKENVFDALRLGDLGWDHSVSTVAFKGGLSGYYDEMKAQVPPGVRLEPHLIRRLSDGESGDVLFEPAKIRVFRESTAVHVRQALEKVSTMGTAASALHVANLLIRLDGPKLMN